MLIIQCDSGHLFGDLVACARYRIDDGREKAIRLKEKTKDISSQGLVHVILIVHLPRRVWSRHRKAFSFVGFQGGSWVSAHIDDIHVTSDSGITLNDAMNASISQLFYNKKFLAPKVIVPEYASEEYQSMEIALVNETSKDHTSPSPSSTQENDVSNTQEIHLDNEEANEDEQLNVAESVDQSYSEQIDENNNENDFLPSTELVEKDKEPSTPILMEENEGTINDMPVSARDLAVLDLEASPMKENEVIEQEEQPFTDTMPEVVASSQSHSPPQMDHREVHHTVFLILFYFGNSVFFVP